jgi:hypothetical protein
VEALPPVEVNPVEPPPGARRAAAPGVAG